MYLNMASNMTKKSAIHRQVENVTWSVSGETKLNLQKDSSKVYSSMLGTLGAGSGMGPSGT